MSIIWGLIIILLLMLELMTANVITLWYALGGVIPLILTFFKGNIASNFAIQLLICVVLGTVLLILFRDKMTEYLRKKAKAVSVDKLIGEYGVVTKPITKTQYGEVKVNKKIWTAYSDKKIELGASIKVLAVDGVKLKVKEKAK